MEALITFKRFKSTFKLYRGADWQALSIVKDVDDKKCRTLYITVNLMKSLCIKYNISVN